jgi:hypothetical protein
MSANGAIFITPTVPGENRSSYGSFTVACFVPCSFSYLERRPREFLAAGVFVVAGVVVVVIDANWWNRLL